MNETLPIFRVLRLVRDARSTSKAERALLNALVLRCSPAKKYACWPSYRLLALDTMLDEVTLKRAAKRLEDAGLIKRVPRQNRANLFFVNVGLLVEQVAAVKAEEDAAKALKDEVAESPFEAPVVTEDGYDQSNNGSADYPTHDDGYVDAAEGGR